VAETSNARRRGQFWGVRTAAVAHVAGRMARQSRLVQAVSFAARTTWRNLRRVLGMLWLEITGLFFIAFAVVFASNAWREYHRHGKASGKLLAAVCFSVLFGWFGVTSFWRARRK
jgi:formate/nitrite transporter FocA (FNT family)